MFLKLIGGIQVNIIDMMTIYMIKYLHVWEFCLRESRIWPLFDSFSRRFYEGDCCEFVVSIIYVFYVFNQCNIAFCVSVLQLMKSSQAQHGLRHGDYARYRY